MSRKTLIFGLGVIGVCGAGGMTTKPFLNAHKTTLQCAETESETFIPSFSETKAHLESLELKQVQIYFRHGARTPLHLIPKVEQATYDPEFLARNLPHTLFNTEIVNLEGPKQPLYYGKIQLKGGCRSGMLTSLGQDQMYMLGRRLKVDYIDRHELIKNAFDVSEVYVRSTNMERTTESLRCVMAGMFGAENLKKKGPIKIPVSHSTKELLFPNASVCHVSRQINHAALIHGSDKPEIVSDREKLEKVIGIDLSKGEKKLKYIDIRDDIVARKAHGLPLPSHVMPYFDQIDKNATKLMRYSFSGQHEAERTVALRLAAGRTIQLVLDNIDSAKSGSSKTKLFLYSGHDTTLFPMVEILDIDDKRWPPFAADIRYELYKDIAGDYWVQVKYLGKPRIVRGCRSEICPLQDFRNALEQFCIKQKEYEEICASNILETIAKEMLEVEVGEVEDAETKERSDIAAGM